MNLFKSLMYLGHPDPAPTPVFEDEKPAFHQTYGNRVASERQFGIHRPANSRRSHIAIPPAWPQACGCG